LAVQFGLFALRAIYGVCGFFELGLSLAFAGGQIVVHFHQSEDIFPSLAQLQIQLLC